jgi:hypothetical protein
MIMKKLVTALALCASFSAFAQVESQNIVGYVTTSIPAGQNWIVLGNGLATVGGTTNKIPLQGFISDISAFTKASGASSADQLWLWDTSVGNYRTFFLYFHSALSTSKNNKWCNTAAWTDNEGQSQVGLAPTTYNVKSGEALWLKRISTNATVQITTAGQVVNDPSITRSIVTSWNFMSSAFAADWNLNSGFDWRGAGATGASGASSADQIWWWDPAANQYRTFFLYYHSALSTSKNNKWCNTATWVDPNGVTQTGLAPITFKIPFGQGSWYLSKGTFSFSEARPFTL